MTIHLTINNREIPYLQVIGLDIYLLEPPYLLVFVFCTFDVLWIKVQ